jgi:hypothetical protein
MPRDDPSILQANVCEPKSTHSDADNSPGRTLVFLDSDNMIDVEFLLKRSTEVVCKTAEERLGEGKAAETSSGVAAWRTYTFRDFSSPFFFASCRFCMEVGT